VDLASPLPKVSEVVNRRQLLLCIASGLLLPNAVMADVGARKKLSWADFKILMAHLAEEKMSVAVKQQQVVSSGLQLLKQLDVNTAEFSHAVDESYESGNRYWLWQRLMKQRNINGGILNIDSEQLVQLHDHPGAIGMVRIISGEAEAWQFDEISQQEVDDEHGVGTESADAKQRVTELVRVSRKILRPGDTAVLTPDRGNIHALRSVTKRCRMLDFFIPPYEISQRNWFEPLAGNWFDMEKISCRKIPQNIYTKA